MDIFALISTVLIFAFTTLTLFTLYKHLQTHVLFPRAEKKRVNNDEEPRIIDYARLINQHNRLVDLHFFDQERKFPLLLALLPAMFLLLPLEIATGLTMLHIYFLAMAAHSHHAAIAMSDDKGLYSIISLDTRGLKKLGNKIDPEKSNVHFVIPIQHATRGFQLGAFRERVKRFVEENIDENSEGLQVETMTMTAEQALASDKIPDEIKDKIRESMKEDQDDNNVLH